MTVRPAGKLLFRVALVSDTHLNEAEGVSASPYPANAEANARARYVFARIAGSGAAFAIHLGDMVNPVPELPAHAPAVANFHALARALPMPLHLIPGNHDIGDKPVSWMPAGTVNPAHVAQYRANFGPDWHAFDHGGCRFVLIDAPLINSGLPEEAAQREWLEAELAASAGRRVFLFTHYPAYVSDREEPGSYDNLDEPGRGWLLGLIERHRPEAVFAAHVHNFWYDRIGPTETYVLPSTCFVRHDYAEMYRIDGGDQKGRNDAAKLGHATLDIFERGHVLRHHRSHGATLPPGATGAPPPVPRPHVKEVALDRVFVDMRHAWAEEMVVAPSGAVDEFRRKRARNDYPVLALWEMGLRGMRVPLQDLEDPRTRRRMEILADAGHLFQVHCYGLPGEAEVALLAAHRALVAALEIVVVWEDHGRLAPALDRLAGATGLPLVISRVNRRDRAKHAGGRFNHLISHGFALEERAEISAALAPGGPVAGVQFTIPRGASPWAAAAALAEFGRGSGLAPRLYVRSTDASPAESFEDDVANARRFAEAAMAAIGHGVPVILDTLDDADRGYFARTGLVDRRFNPRLAGEVMAALVLATEGQGWSPAAADAPVLANAAGDTLSLAAPAEAPPGATCLCPVTGARFPAGRAPAGAPPLVLCLAPGAAR